MKYNKSKEMVTGICKKTVDCAYLTKDGFKEDGVADLKHHGGTDRAVCVYAYEHYSRWEKEFNLKLPPSAFGENITVTNMLEEEVCIGDIYKFGDAVIQVSQGRDPCSTISKRMDNPKLLIKLVETGYSGFLCRVLEEGMVYKDSKITLLEKHPKKITVQFAIHTYLHGKNDVNAMKQLLEVEELAGKWREKMHERLHKQNAL